MKEESLYIKAYNSKSFFRINSMNRYTNNMSNKINGRRVTFNTPISDDYHMYFITTGPVTLKNNNRVHTLNNYDLYIYKPTGMQELLSPYMASYIHCIFSGSCADEILKDIDLKPNEINHVSMNYLSGDKYMFFNKQIEYVWAEFRNQKEYSDVSASCMLIEFLSLYSRNRAKENPTPNMKHIQNVITYLIENHNHSINIEDLIKDTHLSKSQFYRLFNEYTGSSPVQYLQNYRLSAAADYLVLYDMKISEISKILGYDDPLYFSKLFKKEFGVSPKNYVRLHKSHLHIQED